MSKGAAGSRDIERMPDEWSVGYALRGTGLGGGNMIIPQGYPLWAVLNDAETGLFLDPVIAWEYDEGGGTVPRPIGAWYGDLGRENVIEVVTDEQRWREQHGRSKQDTTATRLPEVDAPYVREYAPVSYLNPKQDEPPRPNPTAEP